MEANLVLFMIAGYETTSTALSYASHVLATHSNVQQALYDEINKEFGNDSDVNLIQSAYILLN